MLDNSSTPPLIMDAIVDIQALYGKHGDFLPKEVAVTTLQGDNIGHWVVEAPYGFGDLPKDIRGSNNQLTCYHHGIEWVDGDTPLWKVYVNLRAMCRYAIRIYTRGAQKAEVLQDLLGRDIINLENFEGPSFKKMPPYDTWCIYHGIAREDNATCALNNVGKLKRFLESQLVDTSNPIYSEPLGDVTRKDRPYDTDKKPPRITPPSATEIAAAAASSHGYIAQVPAKGGSSFTANTCDGTVPAGDEIVALFRSTTLESAPPPPTPPKRQATPAATRGGHHHHHHHHQHRRRRPHQGHESVYNEQSGATESTTTHPGSDERSVSCRSYPESLV